MLLAFSLYLFQSCDLMLNKQVYLEIIFLFADIELASSPPLLHLYFGID